MSELDKKIEAALNAEDRDLLKYFDEQGVFAQWFDVYKGKQAWIAILVTIVMFVIFVGAALSAWKFFGAVEAIVMFKWGLIGWILLNMVAFMKVLFWMRMESNRVIREIKRLELQVARLN